MKKRIPDLLRRLSQYTKEEDIMLRPFIPTGIYKDTERTILKQLVQSGTQ